MTHQAECLRCGLPAEWPPTQTGVVPVGPNGEEVYVERLVICQDCLALMHTNQRGFWDAPWVGRSDGNAEKG